MIFKRWKVIPMSYSGDNIILSSVEHVPEMLIKRWYQSRTQQTRERSKNIASHF